MSKQNDKRILVLAKMLADKISTDVSDTKSLKKELERVKSEQRKLLEDLAKFLKDKILSGELPIPKEQKGEVVNLKYVTLDINETEKRNVLTFMVGFTSSTGNRANEYRRYSVSFEEIKSS